MRLVWLALLSVSVEGVADWGWHHGNHFFRKETPAEEPERGASSTTVGVKRNKYYLYTRQNRQVPQQLFETEASIKASNFNGELETVVSVHGWLGSLSQEMNPLIRDAYLNKKTVNVIVVDWSAESRLLYAVAVTQVPDIGKELGMFLNLLTQVTGASLGNMHLVGHSLGAHVVGFAGKYTGGQVARITGLDPAGPLWTNTAKRLSATDAQYVEAIHTDGGMGEAYGIGQPIAKINFYPNGGSSQPGCFGNLCNHARAYRLFAASVTFDKFIGKECSSQSQMSLSLCAGGELAMGNDQLSKTGGLRYYLDTTAMYPYYK